MVTIYKSKVADLDLGKPGGLFTYVFSRNANKFDPKKAAYIDAVSGESYNRKEFKDFALRFGYAVKQKGAKRGDVAMIFSPNSIGFPIAFMGLVAAGVKPTLANSSYQPSELAHQLKDSGAGLVFVHPALLTVLLQTFKLLGVSASDAQKRITILSYTKPEHLLEQELKIGSQWDRFDSMLTQGQLDQEEKFTGDTVLDTILLCYSSGTTGLSKGVETSHKNLTSCAQMLETAYPKMYPDDVCMAVLPYFHIFGAMILVFFFSIGVPQVVMPRFEPELFCKTVAKYKVTISGIVPPVLLVLIHHPATNQYDLTSIKYLMSGAAPLGADLVKRFREKFATIGNTKVIVSQGYGLTETSPAAHVLPVWDAYNKVGSVGQLVPNLQCRLVDDEGKDVPPGPSSAGELWFRGPNIMRGYLNNPSATKNTFSSDGWFMSGDVAVRDDDGFFWIVDRKKELIKYKGFQVPPADLENVIIGHPEVVDVGVIGVWSEKDQTELPRAYVVCTKHSKLAVDPKAQLVFARNIQDFVKDRVAQHKRLRGGVVLVETIPKSLTGKILRKDLRALAVSEAKKAKL